MTKGKFILGAAAAVMTVASAFAFSNHNSKKGGPGTLFTYNGSVFTQKNCVRANGSTTKCTNAVTYYTSASISAHKILKNSATRVFVTAD